MGNEGTPKVKQDGGDHDTEGVFILYKGQTCWSEARYSSITHDCFLNAFKALNIGRLVVCHPKHFIIAIRFN